MEERNKLEAAAGKLRFERRRERQKALLLGIISIFIFLTVWQMLCTLHIVGENVLVSPIKVIQAIWIKAGDTRPDWRRLCQPEKQEFRTF